MLQKNAVYWVCYFKYHQHYIGLWCILPRKCFMNTHTHKYIPLLRSHSFAYDCINVYPSNKKKKKRIHFPSIVHIKPHREHSYWKSLYRVVDSILNEYRILSMLYSSLCTSTALLWFIFSLYIFFFIISFYLMLNVFIGTSYWNSLGGYTFLNKRIIYCKMNFSLLLNVL